MSQTSATAAPAQNGSYAAALTPEQRFLQRYRATQPTAWNKAWSKAEELANPTGNTFGGYNKPQTGDWEMVGVTRKPIARTPNVYFGSRYGRRPARNQATSELVPLWKRREAEAPTSPSYTVDRTPMAPSGSMLARQEALSRAEGRAAMAQRIADRRPMRRDNEGPEVDAGSSPDTTQAQSPTSFEDMRQVGTAYNRAAEAQRDLLGAQARTGIDEIAHAQEQLIRGIDPKTIKISQPKPFSDLVSELKQLRSLI